MDRYLNILQYSVQSLQNRKGLLQNLLNEKARFGLDLTLYCYIYHITIQCIRIPIMAILANTILVSHQLKYTLIETTLSESIQNICILLETSLRQIAVLCVYSPPNNRFDSLKLRDLINTIPKPSIIIGLLMHIT